MDLSSRMDIKANNKAVAEMYKIIGEIKDDDEQIKNIIKLLDDDSCSSWLAHQLLEKIEVDSAIEGKCLKIIKKLAKENYGEQVC